MRVLIIARTYIVRINQKKIQELASFPDTKIMVIVPQTCREAMHSLLLAEEPIGEKFDFLACPVIHFGKTSKYLFKSLDLAMRSFKPDIVHIEEGTRSLTAFQAALYKRIWVPRSKFISFTWDNIHSPLFKPLYCFEKFILSQSDSIICGNKDATKIIVEKGFKRPVHTIPQLGIDADVFHFRDGSELRQKLRLDPEAFVIGFAGRMVKQKGPLLLLEAVARLTGKWILLLIGHGPELELVQSRAKELGILDRIKMIPPVPHYELAKYYNVMDVLVSASISTPRWKEQFGLIVAQAMSSGVPVIGSTCGETPNLIGEAGLIFPEGDSVALTVQLQRLQDDKALRVKLGQLGVERVKNYYTFKSVAEQTYKVWSDLYNGD